MVWMTSMPLEDYQVSWEIPLKSYSYEYYQELIEIK